MCSVAPALEHTEVSVADLHSARHTVGEERTRYAVPVESVRVCAGLDLAA